MTIEDKKFKCIDEGYPIIVPEEIPLELEVRLIAAIKSYQLGNKSVDGTLKKYRDIWRSQIENPTDIKH